MRIHIINSLLSLVAVTGVSAISKPRSIDEPRNFASSDELHTFSKTLHGVKTLRQEDRPRNTTNIAKSWNGATLFSLQQAVESGGNTTVQAGIEVTCTTCYVKGLITAELDFDGDFNISEAIENFTREVGEEINNITSTAIAYIEDEVPGILANATDDLDFDDVDFPPLNISLNLELPEIPECRLHFRFDDLELYMLLDTVLSAGITYTLNLYSSQTPIGVAVDSETFVGVIVSIDLIIGADADIDISSGLHIQVDDGMALDLSLFGQEVSSVTVNGGSFEFLPVTIQSASGVITATLRLSAHAGYSLDIKDISPFVPASTGAEVVVYADLAEFTTNITVVADGDEMDCQLRVQQAYQFALGAAAGATLAIGPETWGPTPETKIPIFYTTLADECANSVTRTTSTPPIPTVTARADGDMVTSILTGEEIYTGMVCISTGLAECPATLQSTIKVTSTKTLVVTVPSGSEATFPATTQDTIPETIPFANNVKSVAATTGSPVSYVPPPPPPPSSSPSPARPTDGPGSTVDGLDDKPLGEVAGVDMRLIIGVSVGVGVPFLAALVAGVYFYLKKRRSAAMPGFEVIQMDSSQIFRDGLYSPVKKPAATVLPVRRSTDT